MRHNIWVAICLAIVLSTNAASPPDPKDDSETLTWTEDGKQEVEIERQEIVQHESHSKGSSQSSSGGHEKTVNLPTKEGNEELEIISEMEEELHHQEHSRSSKKIKLLSQKKPASQSGVEYQGVAELAVDGNRDQNYWGRSCTHTKQQKHPWWKVDLGMEYDIDHVKVWNRADCCGDRLETLKVESSSNDKDWKVIGALKGETKKGGVYTIQAKGKGRYIRLSTGKNKIDVLTLCEVEIYGSDHEEDHHKYKRSHKKPKLISRGKKVSQSSVALKGHAKLAVDGKYNQNYFGESCTLTNLEKNPWWTIDLEKHYAIHEVKVWNRADCCGERLSSLVVESSSNGKVWKKIGALEGSTENGKVYSIKTKGKGRHVRLLLSKTRADQLTLCEVEIYGMRYRRRRHKRRHHRRPVLLSRKKKVSQISSDHRGFPQLAVDGNHNQNYWGRSCTHTRLHKHPWWKVDLEHSYYIDHVKVWNRGDCCGERLNSLIVESSDNDKDWKKIGALKEKAKNNGIYTIKAKGKGRYVRLSLSKSTPEWFTVCEVEVYGNKHESRKHHKQHSHSHHGHHAVAKQRKPVLLSRKKKVSQISSDHRGFPQLAVDGNHNQNYWGRSCTHTRLHKHPWWKVDLEHSYYIDHVKVWNRGDCCGERLNSLIVESSDNDKDWKKIGALKEKAKNNGIYTIKAKGKGRYVRLSLSKSTPEWFTVCEVEVYGNKPESRKHSKHHSHSHRGHHAVAIRRKPELLSRGKPALQSSVLNNGVAKLAVDGNYAQNYFKRSCTHTNLEKHPWWKVDLGMKFEIDHVKVWNRGDCCGERLASLRVESSEDDLKYRQIGALKGLARSGKVYTIHTKGKGRYIRLSLGKNKADHLILCEVEVYGNKPKKHHRHHGGEKPIKLISRGKPASQSSDAFNGRAQLAVDGKYHQNYFVGSCTHTNIEKRPWWKIDLGDKYRLDHVKIWNRADCCGERLRSLIVQSSHDNKKWGKVGELKGATQNGKIYTIITKGIGRYVRLSLSKNSADYLTFCEVEIFGSEYTEEKKHHAQHHHHHHGHHRNHGGHRSRHKGGHSSHHGSRHSSHHTGSKRNH
jgi:hypothetical protein